MPVSGGGGLRGYIELAKRLSQLVGGEMNTLGVFFTSGAEAVENAVKIARAATGRSGIIALMAPSWPYIAGLYADRHEPAVPPELWSVPVRYLPLAVSESVPWRH